MDSNTVTRALGVIILLSIVVSGAVTFLQKRERDVVITYSTSDAKQLKGEISIALDSWIGYFPFRSPVFGKLMRDAGYRVKIVDDHADYPRRMSMLKKGKIDFAVCTVDSYLLNGKDAGYPGIIVSVIDESKGGDAVLSWKESVSNLNQLNKKAGLKIAFTPASPSEHLLKSLAVHFAIDRLKADRSSWAVEVNGAEDAYARLIKKEVDLAVLWEPYVTEALARPGIVKLIGSEDMEKLIVDILLANRNFSRDKPDLVKLVMKSYFETLGVYHAAPDRLESDIVQTIKLARTQVKYMLKGVRWVSFPENVRWFGIRSSSAHASPELIGSIMSTAGILVESGDFGENPLPDRDPYTIVNSAFLDELEKNTSFASGPEGVSGDSLTKRFPKLGEAQWERLRVVGSLRLRPVSFRSGIEKLDDNGREQVKIIVNSIRHYPNYRILVKGHTGLRGDPAENMKLSTLRAASVSQELVYSYGMDPNRISARGMGSNEPLPLESEESDRSYNNRLKRVEVLFVTGM
jgi:outer membrane protein OmpA-like peptidoglycan-associated protein